MMTQDEYRKAFMDGVNNDHVTRRLVIACKAALDAMQYFDGFPKDCGAVQLCKEAIALIEHKIP